MNALACSSKTISRWIEYNNFVYHTPPPPRWIQRKTASAAREKETAVYDVYSYISGVTRIASNVRAYTFTFTVKETHVAAHYAAAAPVTAG